MVIRRLISVFLVILGGVLMFFATNEPPWLGWGVLMLGGLIEAVGITLERKRG
ncbi:hypothetical protein [Sulfurirhabdus autotrophica]|uniref:Uncharacterized protein n=1 Tax=Sulfurirhabdus autotrophica TaxID=1706046 RepID=A0A4R3YBG3_9PROT|nr:hypothetical protein [Sulfurirhabdus autotrophica]TCV89112.1 hypothetical protein EDC63_103184 [Sulfurirhabdus autotrophica]